MHVGIVATKTISTDTIANEIQRRYVSKLASEKICSEAVKERFQASIRTNGVFAFLKMDKPLTMRPTIYEEPEVSFGMGILWPIMEPEELAEYIKSLEGAKEAYEEFTDKPLWKHVQIVATQTVTVSFSMK